MNKLKIILRKDINWAIISVISGVVAVIAASVTVYYAKIIWEKQIHSNRPYFTIIEPGVKQTPKSPPYRIQITMENAGIRPANNLFGKIFIVDMNLKGRPNFTYEFSIANEIPAKVPTLWYNDTFQLPINVPPQYVVLAIEYSDPIVNDTFNQIFYMKWGGVKKGVIDSSFVYVSIEEKMKIGNRIKVIYQDFK